jgi:anhydro-N-acetylmuramic acid kinase
VNRIERLGAIARKKTRVIVGLMSGTSTDAIDAVLVRITGTARARAKIEIIRFASFDYPRDIRRRINVLFDKNKAGIEEICHLDFVVGELFAAAANRLIKEAGLANDQVDLIATTGQTIWYRPRPQAEAADDADWIDAPIITRSVLVVGEPAVIAERTGILTVGNLRARDIAAGGLGAPLVPYFDWAQLRDAKKARCMQNIGGIANVTYVPPKAKLSDVMAFDTGPGNMVMDALVYHVSHRRETFDREGLRAARGRVDERVLAWCMSDPYFQLRPPKASGRERFGRQFARRLIAKFPNVSGDDLIATATAFTAESIARAYRDFIGRRVDEVILAGGGAKNPTLVSMLRERLPQSEIRVYRYLQEKEAMAMALIANDTISGLDTNVPGATGGRPTALGTISI